MTILESMKEILDSGDPTIRSWALIDSYWTPFICSALYVFFVKRLGPALMHNRQPFDLRNWMIFYNFSIVICYASCLLILCFNIFNLDAWYSLCNPTVVMKNHWTYKCATAGWYIYILKYVEFVDTIFFLLRKKFHLITNLHLIHHASLPIICWMMMRTEKSGFQFIPAGINSFIHIIMYTYYGLAAMGPKVQKLLWWKEYLTMLQMGQFVVILFFVFVIVPLSGCQTTKYAVYLDTICAAMFLALFWNFYKQTYKPSNNGTACKISNEVNGDHKNGKKTQNGSNGLQSLKER